MTKRIRPLTIVGAVIVAAVVVRLDSAMQAQRAATDGAAGASTWTAPRTTDGHPDLSGVWDYRTLTPLERPEAFAGKEFLTDEDIAEYEQRAAERPDGRPPDDARTTPSVHPVWWLDYGRNVVGSRRTSLVVDPPDGRIPALTPEAQARAATLRDAARRRGPADDPENRSLWERCITRGLPEGMLPAGYNNNVEIVQTRSHVVVLMEMIHDARIIPIDGRPHLPAAARQWMGDPRGRWEGDTLVVETTNFSEKSSFRGASDRLRVTERFTRTSPETIDYRFTVEDETTWTRPWTVAFPLVKSDQRVYEYACHEGNFGLLHILKGARFGERQAR